MISGLTKNYYITSSMQKINSAHQSILEIKQILESQDLKAQNSSIHSFILEIQQIIESDDLKATPILDHAHPITIKVTFGFLEYVLACKKIS